MVRSYSLHAVIRPIFLMKEGDLLRQGKILDLQNGVALSLIQIIQNPESKAKYQLTVETLTASTTRRAKKKNREKGL